MREDVHREALAHIRLDVRTTVPLCVCLPLAISEAQVSPCSILARITLEFTRLPNLASFQGLVEFYTKSFLQDFIDCAYTFLQK